MKPFYYFLIIVVALTSLMFLVPVTVHANLRQPLDWFNEFWARQYNTDLVMFGFWCTVFTAAWGALMGFITDRIMSLTGLDLTSRDTAE
jgi:hypothetical protein